ncbi:MAG: hypothetical protein ACJ790_17630 [Myxococcaceae bacterium]
MHLRRVILASIAIAALGACQDRSAKTQKVIEQYAIVPGTPQVDTGAPKVLEDPTRATDSFKINTPHQCDVYQQVSVRKVDILWVVDSSGSMAPKQARLAANFQGFMNQLVNAQPPIDFHIAVTTTDTDDAASRGALRPWTMGTNTANFISCTPTSTGGSVCNAGTPTDAVTAFQQMATVGTNGSAVERGLYATYLALTNPANLGSDKFVRPDAALYVVAVSDEDDSSCNPVLKQPICTADPGCRCAPDNALGGSGTYGSTAYYSRFLETYKGYGNEGLVAFAAITALAGDADAGVPSQFGDPNFHAGCCRALDGGSCPTSGSNDGGFEVAYFGGRYLKVASDTGGVAVDICQNDFSGALNSLGYAASGLRKEFRLTRNPDLKLTGTSAAGLDVFVSPPNAANCQVDGNCPSSTPSCRSGRCASKVPVTTNFQADNAQYVRCDGSAFRNVVRFDGASVPVSLSAVEVCYDVLAETSQSCP